MAMALGGCVAVPEQDAAASYVMVGSQAEQRHAQADGVSAQPDEIQQYDAERDHRQDRLGQH